MFIRNVEVIQGKLFKCMYDCVPKVPMHFFWLSLALFMQFSTINNELNTGIHNHSMPTLTYLLFYFSKSTSLCRISFFTPVSKFELIATRRGFLNQKHHHHESPLPRVYNCVGKDWCFLEITQYFQSVQFYFKTGNLQS